METINETIDNLCRKAANNYQLKETTGNWENIKNALKNNSHSLNTIKNFESMVNPITKSYWRHYPVEINARKIDESLTTDTFFSEKKKFELLRFYKNRDAANILITPGSGGHAYVFAELGYCLFQHGFNVFIMPKHGGFTINELITRHLDAIKHVHKNYSGDIHLYGEGLGGLVIFYLAIAGNTNIKTVTCENAPAILTDADFHDALKNDGVAGKRRAFLLPIFKQLVKIFPHLPIPINVYLKWEELIDKGNNRNMNVEIPLVKMFRNDIAFDKYYPLKAVMSLINTPPPKPLSSLSVPVMFIVAKRGLMPGYFKKLFMKLSMAIKKLEEVDGGAFWMLSNPREASNLIAEWIARSKNY